MNGVRQIKRFVFTLILATFFPIVAHAKVIDRIVARVNKEVITLYDVRRAAIPYLLQEGRDPAVLSDEKRGPGVLKEVLDDLINRKLIIEESKKIDLSVSDQEVEQWLGLMRQQRQITEEQFIGLIENYGVNYAFYKSIVRENLLRIQMVRIKIGSQVSVSQEEVDEVFQQRFGADAGKEKYITVSHIIFQPASEADADHEQSRKSAELALERLKNGESFELVAKEMSEGPTGPNGGKLGTFRRGDLDPDFEKVAYMLNPGEQSGIVKTKFGYHIIELNNFEMREAPDIEDRKDRIQGELRAKVAQKLLDEYVEQLRNRAFIDVRNQ